ncbi:MAG: hypothetical protein WDO16_18040 [Bacteroidota bacterium]
MLSALTAIQSISDTKEQIAKKGFAIIDNVFTTEEMNSLLSFISGADSARPAFRKTNDLFAIRRFFKELPETTNLVFNETLHSVITNLFGNDYVVVKSIYFDKPAQSNWFVAYHQDLTISVDKKIPAEGFSAWTVKQDQFSVQPPVEILENNFTIRVHPG